MKVLRASKIGFPCARNLWYSANGQEGETNSRSQRIFDVGNYLEPLVVKWLRDDGWEVEYNQGSQNAPFEVVVPVVEGGEIHGHPDAFISKGDKQNILIDIKTMNDRAFNFWKREGTLKKYPQYADQLHVYATGAMNAGRKVEGLGIVGVNKNNSEMHIDFFEFDSVRANNLILRAAEIFSYSEAGHTGFCPEELWACGYCEYSGICELCTHKKDKSIGEKVAVTEDTEIIDAMELLREARGLQKDGKELEKLAKETLDSKVRQQGMKSVQGGDLVLTFKETIKKQFDAEAFKKAHPEMVPDYMKQVKSLTYELKERK